MKINSDTMMQYDRRHIFSSQSPMTREKIKIKVKESNIGTWILFCIIFVMVLIVMLALHFT